MRTISSISLLTANSLMSIIVIALGISLFVFPTSEISLALQSYTGIYIVFILLCLCEPIKWLKYKEVINFQYHQAILFFMAYGIIIFIISFIYQLYYLSLISFLYFACALILKRIPQNSNLLVEKEIDGQPLKSDSLFYPLPKKSDYDRDTE